MKMSEKIFWGGIAIVALDMLASSLHRLTPGGMIVLVGVLTYLGDSLLS